ncbi:MAG: hypothetical protein ACK5LY_05525 [Lachnospirales bacterium]
MVEKIHNSTSNDEILTKEEFLKRFSKKESNKINNYNTEYSNKPLVQNRRRVQRNTSTINYRKNSPYRQSTRYNIRENDFFFGKAFVCVGILILVFVIKFVDNEKINAFEEKISSEISKTEDFKKYFNFINEDKSLGVSIEDSADDENTISVSETIGNETLEAENKDVSTKTIGELQSMRDFEIESGLFSGKK